MKRTCFLVAPIGSVGSEARKRTDRLESKILRPVFDSLNFEIVRADKIPMPGMITRQIMEKLISADLVISDLTDCNPNVFYEMGIRHVLRSPIIHLIHVGSKIPFDNSDFRTLEYSFDVDVVENLLSELPSIVDAAMLGQVMNPFSSSTDAFVIRRHESGYMNLRSLDLVAGYSSYIETIRRFFQMAENGIEYWFQSSQGTAYPENGLDILAEALGKGASIRAVAAKSPFSARMKSDFGSLFQLGHKIGYSEVDEVDARFFGVSDLMCLIAPKIDGFYGGVIIKDRSLVRHFKAVFEGNFEAGRRGQC